MSVFPPTDWQRIAMLRAGNAADRDAVFADLFERYRRPVLGFLLRRGHTPENAEDLLQDFFTYCLTDAVFEKADAARGKFRNLMLSALQHYAAKQYRHDMAGKRRPDGGFVSPEASESEGDRQTPESAFQRAWAEALMARTLAALRREFSGADRSRHYDIFSRFLVAPMLEGSETPSQQTLARDHGLTEKDVANRLGTTKRAYQRLLREEIAGYARDEAEIDSEIRELFQALGGDFR